MESWIASMGFLEEQLVLGPWPLGVTTVGDGVEILAVV
jgi:hypothetical protein